MAAVSEIGEKTGEHRTIWWRMYVLITTSSTDLNMNIKYFFQRSRIRIFKMFVWAYYFTRMYLILNYLFRNTTLGNRVQQFTITHIL